jgi:uridine kinase
MSISVSFPGGKNKDFPTGTLVEKIVGDEPAFHTRPLVAVRVNNEIVSLTYRLDINCRLDPVALDSREGANIYRRSLCYLLTIAARRLFPDRRLIIGHSLGRGYFYHFDNSRGISAADLRRLRTMMLETMEADLPIRRQVISYSEAVAYFDQHQQYDTTLLLKSRNDPKVPVYRCGDYLDLAHGPLVPRTGLLGVFEIMPYPPGFLLRYPPWNDPGNIKPFEDNTNLFTIYSEYKSWGKILNITGVGRLNELNNQGEMRQFIQIAETLHDKKIASIADKISEQRERIKIILIAGPSSSGKTTFTKKLGIQLRVLGRNPVMISMDNYFVPRDETPRDEEGNLDFEALEAIDIELLNKHLLLLLAGEEVLVPRFDFHIGVRKSGGAPLRLPRRALLILEGIHGLNDRLTPRLDAALKYKIYVSALTQLNLDDHNRISTTDNRLLRRIVRDHNFRGHSAQDTLAMWQSVQNGEKSNIFPFQNSADSAFNSALDYELAVLKVFAEPLLKTVKPDNADYHEARRLLRFLADFIPVPPGWVPYYSILREFIGESGFKY